jgi:hypothetical protein
LADEVATYARDLATLPDGAAPRGVTAELASIGGRGALRVALTEAVRAGRFGIDYVDEPTFVLLPLSIRDGVIEVDVLARLLPDAPDFARAFIGLAYRVRGDGERYESVYLRPLNGRKLNPPAPRDGRAMQYYAYPDWKFDRLREEEPDGGYEAGADIGPDEWINLRVELDGSRVTASVNGDEVLRLTEGKAEPVAGGIGLWVDIGTEGYFSNLRVTPR